MSVETNPTDDGKCPAEITLGGSAVILTAIILGTRDSQAHTAKLLAKPENQTALKDGKTVETPGLSNGEVAVDFGIGAGVGLLVAIGVGIAKHYLNKTDNSPLTQS